MIRKIHPNAMNKTVRAFARSAQVLLKKTTRTLKEQGVASFVKKASITLRRNWRGFFFRPYIINKTINGETFPFLIGDISGEEWYAQEIGHFPELLSHELLWIRENVREGDIVVDCGCHHGLFGVLCAKWVGPRGKVIGFEGAPQNVEIARKNIELNHARNFEVRNQVVGEHEGVVRFISRPNGVVTEQDLWNTICVPMTSLDEVFRSEKPTFLKIDVEGYEREVLRGAQEVMRTLPKLDLEIHCMFFKNPVEAVRELFALLPLKKYEVFLQTGFNENLITYRPEEHNPEKIATYWRVNLFARPRDLHKLVPCQQKKLVLL